MNGAILLAALLASPQSLPASPVPWSYYCWDATVAGTRRPNFKINIQGAHGRGHSWLMTWKDWRATAQPFKVAAEAGKGELEGIAWLAKDNKRQVGRIEFTGAFADGLPRMLMIRIGESHLKPETFDCVPEVVVVNFPSSAQPDF